ncbi:hypothetical protein DPX16_8455 [Anabarilius grahami]|uniref:Uncharacterized protein n=1 Tax=Anabarilius grahami TaxID=495550 RepID=A0A3N0Z3P0_ANAGA|nr:hypothetical protein DPX16_8455 [Anabarilius grahami]
MIRWPDGPTSSDADSTCRLGRKKADEDQLQPTVRNTLRKLSRPTNKNCPTADRQLDTHTPVTQLLSTRTIYRHDGKPLPFMGEKRLEGTGGKRENEKERQREISLIRQDFCHVVFSMLITITSYRKELRVNRWIAGISSKSRAHKQTSNSCPVFLLYFLRFRAHHYIMHRVRGHSSAANRCERRLPEASDKLSSSDLLSPRPRPKGLILIVNTALLNPARISEATRLTEQLVAIFFPSALTIWSLRVEIRWGLEAS